MTRPLRVVFVCTQNKLRSPTAERVFSGRPDLEVASAGTARDAETPLSRDLLEWADAALCMEKRHREFVRQTFKGAKADDEIVPLGIPDDYEFMDEELVDLLERLVPPKLDKFRRRIEPPETAP